MNPIIGSAQAMAVSVGLNALHQIGQTIDDCIVQRDIGCLVENLKSRSDDLQRITEANILVSTMWQLEALAEGRVLLTLPEVEEISKQIQGTLTYLGYPSAEAEPVKAAVRSSLAVYGQEMTERSIDIADCRARCEVEILRAKAEKRSQTIQEVSRGLGHDLNNAFADIYLALHRLKNDGGSEEEVIKLAEDSVRRGSSLVRCLAELGKPPSSGSPFNINYLMDLGQYLEDPRGLTLHLDDSPWLVPGPPYQVARVFENLVRNAKKAMRQSDRKVLTITTAKVPLTLEEVMASRMLRGRGGKPGDFMRVRFTDSGLGIDEEIIDRIFDTQFSTKPKTEVDDSSLHGKGLQIVQNIVADVGGFVTVQNSPGGGAQFDVYLPRKN